MAQSQTWLHGSDAHWDVYYADATGCIEHMLARLDADPAQHLFIFWLPGQNMGI